MPRTNAEEIQRILTLATDIKMNAFNILELSENASVPEIVRAYKALARQVHPDKNKDNPDNAHRAFQALNEAQELAVGEEQSECSISQNNADFDSLFSPESQWMKGPLVRKMRDRMMSFAGFYNQNVDIEAGEPSKIRAFFHGLQLRNEDDKKILTDYADLLFSDTYTPSDSIAASFNSQGLNDSIEILEMLEKRYPQFKIAAEQRFEDELDAQLQSFLQLSGSHEIPSNHSPFLNFHEFSQHFLGVTASKAAPVPITTPNTAAAWVLLDKYAQEHSELLQRLVVVANTLRLTPGLDAPFVYSDTGIEPNEVRAQQINALCVASDGSAVSCREVLDAQLQRFMDSILGVQNANVARLNAQRFPIKANEIEVSGTPPRYNNVLTNNTFENFQDAKKESPWVAFSGSRARFHGAILPVLPAPRQEASSLVGAWAAAGGNGMVFLDKYYGVLNDSDFSSFRAARPESMVGNIVALLKAARVAYEKDDVIGAAVPTASPAFVGLFSGEKGTSKLLSTRSLDLASQQAIMKLTQKTPAENQKYVQKTMEVLYTLVNRYEELDPAGKKINVLKDVINTLENAVEIDAQFITANLKTLLADPDFKASRGLTGRLGAWLKGLDTHFGSTSGIKLVQSLIVEFDNPPASPKL